MRCLAVILFVTAMLLPLESYAKRDEGAYINADLAQYSYSVIFKNLPDILREFKPYFRAVAFVILTGALVFAFKNAHEPKGYLTAVAFAGILSAVMTNSGFLLQMGEDLVQSLNRSLCVNSTYAVADRLYNAALNFHEVKVEKDKDFNREIEKDAIAEAQEQDLLKAGKKTSALGFLKDPMGYIIKGIKSFIVCLIAMIISLMVGLCAFFVVCLETIRYFLIQCGALVVPIFLAGLMTQNFRSQSITFIFGLIGILCWPIGWSLGHMGTIALYDAILEIVNGSIITDSGAAHKVIEVLSETADPFAYATATAGWLAVASIGSLLWLLLMFLGVVIWVILVTFTAPFLIQRCVSSGAQFFSGLTGGTAQTLSRALGGGASYAMIRSARATSMSNEGGGDSSGIGGGTGQRPQPSPALRAGFSAARTMMNASRFQGDPGQMAQVFDTGLDELRQYRAEAAQVDIARSAANQARDIVMGTSPSSKDEILARRSAKKAVETVRNIPNNF